MDPLRNPFSPGAGTPPPELAGRSAILERARIALARIKMGRPEKSMMLVGLRGVGKTVLLNRICELAKDAGFKYVMVEAHEKKPLPALLIPPLRQILFELDRAQQVSEKVKRGLRVLKSFFNGIKLKYNDLEIGIEVDPETGSADSGDLESDLGTLLEVIAEAAADRGTAVAIVIDELQYLKETELSALIMAIHRITQKSLPLVLVGAGLPQLVGLAGKSKSYAERLFDYPSIGALSGPDATEALREPVTAEGATISDDAVSEVLRNTQGYPYFLQEWGYQAWNLAQNQNIDMAVVQAATREAIRRLDESFFRVRFDRLTPREKEYMRALADGDGQSLRSGDIADRLGVTVNSVAPIRNSLIKKGMVYSPSHGDTAFTVPLFDAFMKRIMPG